MTAVDIWIPDAIGVVNRRMPDTAALRNHTSKNNSQIDHLLSLCYFELLVKVVLNSVMIAHIQNSIQVPDASHPPTSYLS